MVKKAVTIRGAPSLRRVLRQAPKEVGDNLREAIAEGAEALHRDMLANVPRDSGDLAASIGKKVSRDGFSARVGPGAKGKRAMRKAGWRAHFAEFGTKYQAAQPFVEPAMKRNEPEIRGEIADGVRDALIALGKM